MTHTHEQWAVEHTLNDETYIMDGDDSHVATIWRSQPDYERYAALIVAAPAMLEALKAVTKALNPEPHIQGILYADALSPENDDETVLDYLRKTIRLAEGRG